jgi:hypothetical protein
MHIRTLGRRAEMTSASQMALLTAALLASNLVVWIYCLGGALAALIR